MKQENIKKWNLGVSWISQCVQELEKKKKKEKAKALKQMVTVIAVKSLYSEF